MDKLRSNNKKIQPMKAKDSGLNLEMNEQCIIIRLDKDLDHHNSLLIREKTDKLIDMGNVKKIIFNFEQTEFMDSSGIGVIMGRYKRMLVSGGKVIVTNVSDTIDRIFLLAGLYKIVSKCSTVKEAMERL